MITRAHKQAVCERHRQVLRLLYHFGKGVAYQNHILRYMSIFEGVHEIDGSKCLQELKKNEILETYSLFGAKVLKLKKFAVYFLEEKEREEVFSIKFTAGKAKKSAFLNEIILRKADTLKKSISSLEELLDMYLNKTTYFCKDKHSYTYLQHEIQAGRCASYAEKEVSSLIRTKEQGHTFKAASNKIVTSYNLNSMQSSNIYCGLESRTADGQMLLHVDILDVNGLITPVSFARKVIDTHLYLDQLFDRDQVDFRYALYTQSEERKSYILRHQKTITESIRLKTKQNLKLMVINLDLEKTLFRGQKVLLGV